MKKVPPPYQADTNENLFGYSPLVREAMQQALNQLNNYPQPDAADLRHALADRLGMKPDELLIGSGSAELISLLVRRFCGRDGQGEILSLYPSYPLYRMEAQALHITFKELPLTSAYQVDLAALHMHVNRHTRLFFLCNPNNPTGTYITQGALKQVLDHLPPHVTLVVDEAYKEYTAAADCADALALIPHYPNLVVLRTFSKAFGLASVRIGYMVAQHHLIAQAMEIKQPYNVNQLAQVAALAALADSHFLETTLKATQAGKASLAAALQRLGVKCWPSEGNFLLIDAGVSARTVYDHLLANNVAVRLVGDGHTLRLTIGPEQYQSHLLSMLEELLQPDRLYPTQPLLAEILKIGTRLAQSPTAAVPEEAFAQLDRQVAPANAENRIAAAFARALAARQMKGTPHGGNLYASNYGEMDMIAAFNVLVTATPLVSFGHRFANHSILAAITGKPAVYLLDLGIGSGLQWFHLMEQLAAQPGEKPQLHLTGIDIPDNTSADPLGKLHRTGERLTAHANRVGLKFSYTAIASRLEDFDLGTLPIAPTDTLVVNAALTLHHLADGLVAQPDQRDRVLQQVMELRPVVLLLTEPDSEHNRLEFLPRLRESLRHYHTVFDVLDTLLPPDMPERLVIEQEFFGREIMNVMACEGEERVERHERLEAWERRLIRNGFVPAPRQDMQNLLHRELDLHPNFTVIEQAAGYSLHWKGLPIIAATAWQPLAL